MYYLCKALKRHFKQDTRGFSLIEMAIMLIVIGILMGTLLPGLRLMQEQQRNDVTHKNTEKILFALGTRLANGKDLPFASAVFDEGTPCDKNHAGFVPFRTLCLSKATALDGWGNPIKYVRAVDDLDTEVGLTSHKRVKSIKVYDKDNVLVYDPDSSEKEGIAIVLIAYNKGTLGQSLWEIRNINDDDGFIDAPYSVNPKAPFRHSVKYATLNQLLSVHVPINIYKEKGKKFNPGGILVEEKIIREQPSEPDTESADPSYEFEESLI